MGKWWQIMSVILLVALFVAAPFAIISLISGFDPLAIFRRSKDFAELSPYHFTLQWVIWLSIAFLAWAYWLNATAFSKDIEAKRQLSEQLGRDAASERPPAPVELAQSPLDRAIQYFEEQGYTRVRGFQGTDDVSLLVYAKDARLSDGLYRREGAIIFPKGDSAKINTCVLHDSDSWEFNSEYKIQRARMGRAVKIKTALNRPYIQGLIDRSHHILTIGLASRENAGNEVPRDIYLSYVRGYNIGYTIWELGWKPAERIYPLFLGPAKQPPSDPTLQPLQRSVVIVGVNGTVEVLSSDAVMAAMILIDLNFVDLNAYEYPADQPPATERIRPDQGLLDVDQVMKRRQPERSDDAPALAWAPIKLPPRNRPD
jgi:hypothetical protein